MVLSGLQLLPPIVTAAIVFVRTLLPNMTAQILLVSEIWRSFRFF